MKLTLLIPAAGLGSRFCGLKQMEEVGPCGETLIDYSVFDAIRAGFHKVVFVIRQDFEKEFKCVFSKNRFSNKIEIDYAFQAIDKIPIDFKLNSQRKKPWGAGHALLMAADIIQEPFAVINADDFYGYESFKIVADFLKNNNPNESNFCMPGYILENTLSDKGGVTRAICYVDGDKFLTKISEIKNIKEVDNNIVFENMTDTQNILKKNDLVSMNFWGFTESFMNDSKKIFYDFLKQNINNLEAECHIPYLVGKLVEGKKAKIKVIETPATWFGLTWLDDKTHVINSIKSKIKKGDYPNCLWTI